MKPPRYPRLTPLKAFALLRELDETVFYFRGTDTGPIRSAVERTRDALASHVRAAIVKGARR